MHITADLLSIGPSMIVKEITWENPSAKCRPFLFNALILMVAIFRDPANDEFIHSMKYFVMVCFIIKSRLTNIEIPITNI